VLNIREVIREMQNNITMRYHIIYVRIAIFKKITNVGKNVEKGKHLFAICRILNCTATMENSMGVPQK
jgi:hypothetical protein